MLASSLLRRQKLLQLERAKSLAFAVELQKLIMLDGMALYCIL